ncbi:MAG: hypothetical protein DRJ15_13080, partial [Bacteroidetes bacterium]
MTTCINSDRSYTGLVEKYIGTAYDNVKLVADNIDAVIKVATIDFDDLSAVADIADEVGIVAGIADAVVDVSTNMADVTNVSTNMDDVNIVASNITFIETCASNIEEIKNASSNAQLAADNAGYAQEWAVKPEDTPVSVLAGGSGSAPYDYSAYHNAMKAAASYDSFDDRYLGAFTDPPTVNNDDDGPLIVGALYWDTTYAYMRVWDGVKWENIASVGITYYGLWEATAGTEYPTTNAESGFWFITNDPDYTFIGGDLIGQTVQRTDYIIWNESANVWETTNSLTDLSLFLHSDGSVPMLAPLRYQTGAGASEMKLDYQSLLFAAGITFAIQQVGAAAESGFHITNAGDVGIGIAAPQAELDVVGNIHGSGTIKTGGSSANFAQIDDTDGLRIDNGGAFWTLASESLGTLSLINPNTNYIMHFTSAPELLTIAHDVTITDDVIIAGVLSVTGGSITTNNDGTSINWKAAYDHAQALHFVDGIPSNSLVHTLGNVGIGTNNPLYSLHAVGNTVINEILFATSRTISPDVDDNQLLLSGGSASGGYIQLLGNSHATHSNEVAIGGDEVLIFAPLITVQSPLVLQSEDWVTNLNIKYRKTADGTVEVRILAGASGSIGNLPSGYQPAEEISFALVGGISNDQIIRVEVK